jgi:hypothetical protein
MSANDIAIFTIDSKRINKEDFYSAADVSLLLLMLAFTRTF